MSKSVLCGISLEDFLIRMEEFHGYRSPGLLLGGIMVDIAMEELGPVPYLNMVTETVVCLPDAVQLLTPCTIGNGFLQILDWGKFALAGYDRLTLSGVRVWVNPDRLSQYPSIDQWFDRSKRSAEKPPFEDLVPEILAARNDLLNYSHVRLHRALKDSQPVPTRRCADCGEFYPARLGASCPACQGKAYYVRDGTDP